MKKARLPRTNLGRLVAKVRSIIFLWGVSFSLFLSSSILAKANSLSIQDPDYQDGIPKQTRVYFELVGNEYGIAPELLEAIAYRESRFIPTVKNGNHYGLMQVNVKTHSERIAKYGWTANDMLDPYKNLMVAADYLLELFEEYEDVPLVLCIYSGNWKAVARYKEFGFMPGYCEDVLERSAEYERLHGK